jgi:hypothetical protein
MTLDAIESIPDMNCRLNPTHAIVPHTEGLVLELLVNSIQKNSDERTLEWIDTLDPDRLNELVEILAEAHGVASNSNPSHSRQIILASLKIWQKQRRVPYPGIEGGRDGIDTVEPIPVDGSNALNLVDHSEQDSRPFRDISIQRPENDISLSPQDALPLSVPKPIPQEIQALIDAYVFGKPLTIIVSNERLQDHWALHLPREYGYVVMGFYRIIGVEVRSHDT